MNQLTADACERTVYAGPVDATAIGNILVQLLAHRQIVSVAEGRELVARSFAVEEYQPRDSQRWAEQLDCARQLDMP